jgi:putative methyltransferase (TIGR04325 family)
LADCGGGYSNIVLNAVRFFTAANIIEGLMGNGISERLVPSIPETIPMFQTIYRNPAHQYRILDFGGGFALCHFLLRRRMPHRSRWAVVETSQTVALGKAFESEDLRFFDTIESAQAWLGEVDAVHTNGALQYHPSPEIALESLVSLGARYIALLRCALSEDIRAIQVQESLLSRQLDAPLPGGVSDRPVRYPHISMLASDFTGIIMRAKYVPVQSSNHANTVTERAAAIAGTLHNSHFLFVKSA